MPIRLSVLESFGRVSDRSKLEMLLPIVENSLDDPVVIGPNVELENCVLQTFDSSTAKVLNAENSGAWSVLSRAIDRYVTGGEYRWYTAQDTSIMIRVSRTSHRTMDSASGNDTRLVILRAVAGASDGT